MYFVIDTLRICCEGVMLLFVWYVFGSIILGVLVGCAWWLIQGRKTRPPSGLVTRFTALGAGAVLFGVPFLRTATVLWPVPSQLFLETVQ